jgi:hypothetical protein
MGMFADIPLEATNRRKSNEAEGMGGGMRKFCILPSECLEAWKGDCILQLGTRKGLHFLIASERIEECPRHAKVNEVRTVDHD